LVLVQPEAKSPYLLRPQSSFGAEQTSLVPRSKLVKGRSIDECPITHLFAYVSRYRLE
jgi:hypothetical protein